MDKKILEYAKQHVLNKISFIEDDLYINIYGEQATILLKERLKYWQEELEEINKMLLL
jgi:hypothetical protein